MAITTHVGSFDVTTATAGNTIAVTGVGFQPKALILWWVGRSDTTDAVGRATFSQGIGVATSTTSRWAVGARSEDAAASSVAHTRHQNDACVIVVSGGGGENGNLDLQSLDSDGFTMVIDLQFDEALRVHYMAIGGDSITNVATGSFTESLATGTQDITDPGFQPDFGFFVGNGQTNGPGNGGTSALLSVGAADASLNQATSWGAGRNNVATTDTGRGAVSGSIGELPHPNAPTSVRSRMSLNSWLSTGFQVNWAEVFGNTRHWYYLVLQGGDYLVGDLTTQTDTVTNITESAFGFEPSGVFFGSHAHGTAATNVGQNDNQQSIGATDGTNRRAIALLDIDASSGSQVGTAIEHDAVYVNLINSSGTVSVQGLMDVTSLDSGGFTAIMDDADPSGNFVWYAAFGPAAAGGTSHNAAHTDGAGATDIEAAQSVYARPTTDAAGATDITATTSVSTRTTTDDAGATDLSTYIKGQDRTEVDDAGATDIEAAQSVSARTEIDDAGASDIDSAIQTHVRSETGDAGATDIDTAQSVFARTEADDSGATDLSAYIKGQARTEVDDAGATDSSSAVQAHARTETDDADAADLNSVTAVHVRAEVDDAGATDTSSYSTSGADSKSEIDDAGATDSAATVAVSTRAEVDGASATDVASPAAAFSRSEVDDGGGSDVVVSESVAIRSAADDAGATDTSSYELVAASDYAETDDAGATDIVISVSVAARAHVDSGATDTAAADAAAQRSDADNAGATDDVLVSVGWGRSAVDGAVVTDDAVIEIGWGRASTDDSGAIDSATRVIVAARAAIDSGGTDLASYTHTPAAPIVAGGSISASTSRKGSASTSTASRGSASGSAAPRGSSSGSDE